MSERTREQIGVIEVPRMCRGSQNYPSGCRSAQELRGRTYFAEFMDGETRRVLQDVDVDGHAHCDTPEKYERQGRREPSGAIRTLSGVPDGQGRLSVCILRRLATVGRPSSFGCEH